MGDIVRVVRRGKFIGWYVRYKDVDGRRKMRASHQPSRELARRYLLEVEGRVARGTIGIPEPAAPVPTVAVLLEGFLTAYHRPRIKDMDKYRATARRLYKHILPHIGNRPADAVSSAEVAKLSALLLRDIAPRTVGVTLAHLSVAYTWAVRTGLLPSNPVRGVERPRVEDLVEYLTMEEVRAVLSLSAQRAEANLEAGLLHVALFLALHTGLRKGELLGLRWQDVDVRSMRLTVAKSYAGTPKGGRVRHLRLPAVAAPVLSAWYRRCPKTAPGLICPLSGSGSAKAGRPHMGRANDMLGLPELLQSAGVRSFARPWHALRHTFASHFVMSGGNILSLQKILGHSDIKMTLVYAHLAPNFLEEEMNRVKY